MPKIILSCDQNQEYLFYVPITTFVCEYFGFKPLVIILGKSKYTDLVYEYTKKFTNSEIIEIDSISPYRDTTIVQFSRLYAACLIEDEDEYIMTGDIDMLILNNYLYNDFDKMNLHGSDLTGYVHYPICYIGMTVKKWRNLLDLEYGKFKENMLRDLEEEKKLATSEVFTDFWYTDQRFITRRIKEYGEDKFNIVDRTHNAGFAVKRIDRALPLTWDIKCDDDYIDCHMLKNGYVEENFNKILNVIKLKVDKDSVWMKEYREKYIKIINER